MRLLIRPAIVFSLCIISLGCVPHNQDAYKSQPQIVSQSSPAVNSENTSESSGSSTKKSMTINSFEQLVEQKDIDGLKAYLDENPEKLSSISDIKLRLSLTGPSKLRIIDIYQLISDKVKHKKIAAQIASEGGPYKKFSAKELAMLKKMSITPKLIAAMDKATIKYNKNYAKIKQKESADLARTQAEAQKQAQELAAQQQEETLKQAKEQAQELAAQQQAETLKQAKEQAAMQQQAAAQQKVEQASSAAECLKYTSAAKACDYTPGGFFAQQACKIAASAMFSCSGM